MNKNTFELDQILRDLPQLEPEQDVLQHVLDKVSEKKKSRYKGLYWLAAASVLFVTVSLNIHLPQASAPQNDQQLEALTVRVEYIESLVLSNLITHSEPGSELLEKIVSIENLLDQLNQEILVSQDNRQKIKLMHAKLDVLGDLAALHKKLGARTSYRQLI